MRRTQISSISFNMLNQQIGDSRAKAVVFCFLLSWIYAICAQVVIPLPFNIVPIVLHPLPLYIAVLMFGNYATYAYLLYFIQGAVGLPFFAGFTGGIVTILGPTGGYLIGFGLAMAFLSLTRNITFYFPILLRLVIAAAIVYACGLLQLSFFVPQEKLLILGLYPFIIGHSIKIVISWMTFNQLENHLACKRDSEDEAL